ncbi:hypothetical protein [Amorphus sp. 3PC139-8]|uniref:hypothetical protein n=1 Tax=Amorphus sp. 3PC139-8 TaxID=2735676 RepID=UPI00345D4661
MPRRIRILVGLAIAADLFLVVVLVQVAPWDLYAVAHADSLGSRQTDFDPQQLHRQAAIFAAVDRHVQLYGPLDQTRAIHITQIRKAAFKTLSSHSDARSPFLRSYTTYRAQFASVRLSGDRLDALRLLYEASSGAFDIAARRLSEISSTVEEIET